MKKLLTPAKNQDGLVAIIIVTTITIILSLMTIGFARLMDREFREALDLELSTQAYYAAETGLNNARSYIASTSNPSTGADCLNVEASPQSNYFVKSISGSYNNDANDNLIKYTCVLIDSSPTNLTYSVGTGKSVVFKMTPSSDISQLYFSWQNSESYGGSALQSLVMGVSGNPLPQENNVPGSATGLLRVSVYPVPAGLGSGGNSNSLLSADAGTYFLYPNVASTGTTSGSISSAGYDTTKGRFINGNCHQANSNNNYLPDRSASGLFCNSRLTGVPVRGEYYIRLTAVYKDLQVSIQAVNLNGLAVPINNAQAVIDVTGEGNDVLRRIQARASLSGNFETPEYAVKSLEALCKRLRLPKLTATTYGEAFLDPDTPNDDGACKP